MLPEKDYKKLCLKAHEVRAVAASTAFKFNCSVQSIMDAACWRSHMTFTSFYLKEDSVIMDDLYSLGPIVVSQQVVGTED